MTTAIASAARRLPIVPLLLALLGLSIASSASAFAYKSCPFGRLDWGQTAVTFYPSSISFPAGSPSRSALEAAFDAWNFRAPGSQFRFGRVYDGASTITFDDGKPSVGFTSGYNFGIALAVTQVSYNCVFASHITDADIIFNPAYTWSFDPAPASPFSPYSPFNMTQVAIHEMGHAMGLEHSHNTLATMNDRYPDGGPVGELNTLEPLSDDVAGDRYLNGTCCSERDVFASLYQATGTFDAAWIVSPVIAYRGLPFGFPFTIGNRGTQAETFRVDFYLSSDRTITPADFYLGSSTVSAPAGSTGTLNTGFYSGLPLWLTPGLYYAGYIVDAQGSVPEVEEGNNSVALIYATLVPSYTPPTACINPGPTSGAAPFSNAFDGSCSSDPDGSIASFAWDFGDGSSGSGSSVSHTYWSSGSYTVQLTVTDNSGRSSSTSRSLYVTPENCEQLMKDGTMKSCI